MTRKKVIQLNLHPQVASYLNIEKQAEIKAISRRFRKKILVHGNEKLHRETIDFVPVP